MVCSFEAKGMLCKAYAMQPNSWLAWIHEQCSEVHVISLKQCMNRGIARLQSCWDVLDCHARHLHLRIQSLPFGKPSQISQQLFQDNATSKT